MTQVDMHGMEYQNNFITLDDLKDVNSIKVIITVK